MDDVLDRLNHAIKGYLTGLDGGGQTCPATGTAG
jgi:hypothetical protein